MLLLGISQYFYRKTKCAFKQDNLLTNEKTSWLYNSLGIILSQCVTKPGLG